MRFSLLTVLATLPAASAGVVSLTESNFNEVTDGKNVFIKFFAPWCGFCKKMAGDWEKLANDFEGHENGLVAEVNCDEQQELCGRFGLEGYPTMLYGNAKGKLKKYEAGRSYDDLSKFAITNIATPVNETAAVEEEEEETSSVVVQLTAQNFEQMTTGKTVFIKFYAPWCGFCKKLAPDWEKLAAEWDGHEIGLVAEVNCDEEQELCSRYSLEGYPTMLYGNAQGELEKYEEGRSFEALSAFAKDTLDKPACTVDYPDSCSDEVKELLSSLEKVSIEDLTEQVKGMDEKIKEAEATFEMHLDKIQAEYQKYEDINQAEVKKIKSEGNYKFAKAVLLKRGGVVEDNDHDEL